MHMLLCTHTHTHTHSHADMCVHAYGCVHKSMHTYRSTFSHMHNPSTHPCVYTHTHIHTSICLWSSNSLSAAIHCWLWSLRPHLKKKRAFLGHSIWEWMEDWVFHLLLYSQRSILSTLLSLKREAGSKCMKMRAKEDHGSVENEFYKTLETQANFENGLFWPTQTSPRKLVF